MPQFQYEAHSRDGERSSGAIHAADQRAAARALRDEGLFPVRIDEVGASPWGSSVIHYLRPVSAAHLAQFFTQLASLLRAGVNAHDAFDELSDLLGDRRLRRVAREISEQAAEGVSLAEQFARYPAVVPRSAAGFVEAGEELGALPQMLDELAGQYETDARLQGRLKWLRVYYSAVLVLALLVAPFPWMVARGFGWYAELAATRLLPILAGAIVLLYALRALNAIRVFADLRSRVAMAIPVFGSLTRWSAVARFLRTLNLAQRAGVTFHRALELAAGATGNESMRAAATRAATAVRRGESLDDAVASLRFLPRRVREMIAGGERTGELDRRLDAAADYAIERRDSSVNAISASTAAAALAGSAVIALIALIFAWRNFYEALFERAGV